MSEEQPPLFPADGDEPPAAPGPIVGPDFNGPVYEREHDHERLTGQILRVYEAMKDGRWRTLAEIERLTGDPQASISAQLRHLRKERFGAFIVNKQPRGERDRGLWEYQLLHPEV